MDINNELLKETEWLDPNISNLSDDETKGQHVPWEVYHPSLHPETHKPNVIISILPLFY